MKIKYTKPDFVIERFDLSQSIAANCSAEVPSNPLSSLGDPNWSSKETCGWRVGQYVIWSASNCQSSTELPIIVNPNAEVMGFCYNNPSGSNVIFRS